MLPGGGGIWLEQSGWVCNTSPSSFLIKLPSYYFMWITARTKVLLEPPYQSGWKKRANWVKWIIWTHVCCTSQPFRANVWINNVLFSIHLEKVDWASRFHSKVQWVQTRAGCIAGGGVCTAISSHHHVCFTWRMAVYLNSCPLVLNSAALRLWYRSLKNTTAGC